MHHMEPGDPQDRRKRRERPARSRNQGKGIYRCTACLELNASREEDSIRGDLYTKVLAGESRNPQEVAMKTGYRPGPSFAGGVV